MTVVSEAMQAREQDGLDKLRDVHRRLGGLLLDPQPGLLTWNQMLSDTLLECADYAGHGMLSEEARGTGGKAKALDELYGAVEEMMSKSPETSVPYRIAVRLAEAMVGAGKVLGKTYPGK